MDGLAGGIGLIAALFLAFFFYQQGDLPGALVALSLAEHGIWVRQLRLEFTEETD
jgi:UDP-N-acetylmuramyl pentapeptide phosphotransferase/UDP-N-acetylglucosamine-1-phosphate transferase